MDSYRKTTLWRVFFMAILAVNTGAVIWLWHGANLPLLTGGLHGTLIAYGRLAGLLLECAILLQLVLIARIPILERSFGFDKMNKLHRYIGYSLAALFLTHPILLLWGYGAINNRSGYAQFLDFFYNWEDVAKAMLAVLILAVIVLFTVFFRKRVQYETWHGIHLLGYVAIALAFGHQINFADVSYGWGLYRWLALNFVVFGLLLFYRFIRPLLLYYRHRFYVREIKQETPDIWSVLISGRHMDKFRFEPGQFAQWFFLDKGFILPHPFTFSAAPNGETVRVTPKASGDFTRRIKDLRPGSKVLIDGPLGRFTAAASSRDKFLLIAGGVGITPIRALVEGLARDKKDAVVLYSARSENDFALAHEIQKEVRLYKFVSDTNSPQAGFESGRIDLAAIRRLVPDFLEREVYTCGPEPMMDAVELALRFAHMPKKHIHIERFAF